VASASPGRAVTRRISDGTGLLLAFRAAVANLERHVAEVNDLNVFPVPDGDTGSNMLATMRVALEEAELVVDRSADEVAAKLSLGALMGARGNSGVIASQICRGLAQAFEGKRQVTGPDLAQAFARGAELAYAAVGNPVEGTILTVIRQAADAADEAARNEADLEGVLHAAVHAAHRAVGLTPDLLPVLREAGVVDSGGQGLFRLLEGALLQVEGRAPAEAAAVQAGPGRSPRAGDGETELEGGFGFETMLVISPRPGEALAPDEIRRGLEGLGQSVVVVGDDQAVKIHVHSEQPDAVLAYALELGSLSRISVENLDQQADTLRELRAAQFTGAPEGSLAPIAVVAVAPGDGLAKVFREMGAAGIVQGGQSANPSTGDLLVGIEAAHAVETLLLPNNANVLLAAQQVTALAARSVRVVPTRSAAEGIAALMAFDPAADGSTNAEAMTLAGRAIESLSVTSAVRDATVSGRRVRKGQSIVLDPDDGLVAAGRDDDQAIEAAIRALRPGIELVSLFFGQGVERSEADRLAGLIGRARPGVEVEVCDGGQPHYRYLISAE
jgi:uncharacterized protein